MSQTPDAGESRHGQARKFRKQDLLSIKRRRKRGAVSMNPDLEP